MTDLTRILPEGTIMEYFEKMVETEDPNKRYDYFETLVDFSDYSVSDIKAFLLGRDPASFQKPDMAASIFDCPQFKSWPVTGLHPRNSLKPEQDYRVITPKDLHDPEYRRLQLVETPCLPIVKNVFAVFQDNEVYLPMLLRYIADRDPGALLVLLTQFVRYTTDCDESDSPARFLQKCLISKKIIKNLADYHLPPKLTRFILKYAEELRTPDFSYCKLILLHLIADATAEPSLQNDPEFFSISDFIEFFQLDTDYMLKAVIDAIDSTIALNSLENLRFPDREDRGGLEDLKIPRIALNSWQNFLGPEWMPTKLPVEGEEFKRNYFRHILAPRAIQKLIRFLSLTDIRWGFYYAENRPAYQRLVRKIISWDELNKNSHVVFDARPNPKVEFLDQETLTILESAYDLKHIHL